MTALELVLAVVARAARGAAAAKVGAWCCGADGCVDFVRCVLLVPTHASDLASTDTNHVLHMSPPSAPDRRARTPADFFFFLFVSFARQRCTGGDDDSASSAKYDALVSSKEKLAKLALVKELMTTAVKNATRGSGRQEPLPASELPASFSESASPNLLIAAGNGQPMYQIGQ